MMDEIPLAPASRKKPTVGASPPAKSKPPEPPRRSFLSKAAAVLIGGFVGLVPLASGLVVFFDPLRRRNGVRAVRLGTLDALPADGIPRPFPVLSDRQDAWNRFPNEPVGMVFLRRLPNSPTVEAYSATCPHAGCIVDFKPARNQFQCPCHTSAFEADGQRVMPCVAPRGLDALACEVRRNGDEQEIWVEFINFYSGMAEKKPKA
jgi:quinol---cytochrome c reductase iron-sulfur subunit, bacillus type